MTRILGLTGLLLCTATPVLALQDGLILIWTGANRDRQALEAAVQPFVEDYGIPVSVEVVDPDLAQKFQQAASTGDGPDIVMWAHDRFGEWASGGLIAPVQPSAGWAEGILGSAMEAMQFDNATWGYPVSVEAVHLIYNTDLIDTPPASFDDLIAMDHDGAKILWDYTNAYFSMPLLMANGGYAFRKVDGSYDGTETGVNNEGAIQGGEMLRRLIDEGVMPTGVDYGIMDGAMNRGDVAMVLNGPWAWSTLAESGINFAVAPIPTVGDAVTTPFVGVQAMALNAASPNRDLAVELLENYLLTEEGLATWNANGALGALADESAAAAQDDANIAGMLEIAATGVPMPSNAEMGAYWAAMQPALTNIVTGAQTAEAALNDAAARILGER
ncbi:maltose/maltodextrin ABC transporter substrate-binding protein MalE [Paracoccus aestuarii]|uniref:Maltodextrin-binding protein n=1 Tax=Paracoccus aestuarii TaxID=453842 RepID=A0A419A1P4_9RHOB|nr:maltose/maltodextrin ABC transporter substrate-binding protein MalE [Paracoccus aestuarii]RJL06891.1 maltose/maltodextrin ABC transporter substrate-binding protein MalE [Paracoccus aestuarii]WCQ99785.1 maltose/maltodextrin ABC transporter substrate-binding protein MalE [Paracoccus aestuarii]